MEYIDLMNSWNNGNRATVVSEIMLYENSHTAAINFFHDLKGKDKTMFLSLIESYEEEQYFGVI